MKRTAFNYLLKSIYLCKKSMSLIMIATLFTQLTYSQTTTFPTENARWRYYTTFEETITSSQQDLDGDSIYGGVEYQKIASSYITLFGDDSGLIRSENNVVYFIPKDCLEEIVLYDFTLAVGDTFEVSEYHQFTTLDPVVVASIDSIMTNDGIYRKRFNFSTGVSWIEGIGADYGSITYPYYFGSISGDPYMRCFTKDDVDVYEEIFYWYLSGETYAYDCQGLITDIDEITKIKIDVYPNPFENTLQITTDSNEPIEQIVVYNASLQIVEIFNYSDQITFSQTLSNGLYILELKTKDSSYYKKLIRK